MSAAVMALGLLGAIFHSQSDTHIERYVSNGWRVVVKQDRFTGQKHCTASVDAMTYDRGVVTFHFPTQTDTANALFKVDSDPARPAGEVAVEAAGLGASFSGRNLQNPSNGEVHIPARYLASATTVGIKPNDKAGHRDFKLRGVSAMLATMQAHGCVVD